MRVPRQTLYYIAAAAVLLLAAVVGARASSRRRKMALELLDTNEPSTMSTANYPSRSTCGTRNFKQAEFDCNDGTPVPNIYKGNVQVLMEQLEILRVAVGQKPITINSGYRHAAYNRAQGGSPNSQHLVGKAADIVIAGMTPKQVAAQIESLIRAGKMKQGGLGIYPSFTHYDIRGTRARW